MVGKIPKRKERPGVDVYGRTPLHNAILDGELEIVRRLLQAGSDTNAVDDRGWTPLHFAAAQSNAACIALLVGSGASVGVRDAFGNTPLGKAVYASAGDGECIKLLRAAGADPLAENNHGVSPVALARNISNFPVAQYFEDLP